MENTKNTLSEKNIMSSSPLILLPGEVILTVWPGAGVRLLSCKYQISVELNVLPGGRPRPVLCHFNASVREVLT